MSGFDHDTQQKRILFGALQRLLEVGGAYLTITPDGIDVVDRFHKVHPVRIGHEPIVADIPIIRHLIQNNMDWSGRGSHMRERTPFVLSSSTWDTSAFGAFNEWSLVTAKSGDDQLVITPRKRLPMSLDQVFKVDPDSLARLRSLYRKGGFSIGVICRGETRADAVIAALTAERNQVNLPSNTKFLDKRGANYRTFGAIATSNIDSVPYIEGANWIISGCDRREVIRKLIPGPDDITIEPSARVFVGAYPGHGGYLPQRKPVQDHLNDPEHPPALVITVDVTSDGPVAEFTFSKSLRAMTSPDHGFKHAPWDVIGEQKAKRDAKPKAPKTWFSTTEDVAKSFVARQAPRGYVSSKTLFFHGPIAYSIVDRNPIAAILDTPSGKPLLLVGRTVGFGGTKAGTVSGAIGDVVTAAGNDFRILHIGSPAELLRYAGKRLEDLPARFRRDKDEDVFPESASLHKTALAKWLRSEYQGRMGYLEKALETTFATGVKANAYSSLAHICALRDAIADTYGINLPVLGNAKSFHAKASTESKASQERLRELRERKSSSPSP
jgi:hypothetical protein